MSRNHSEDPVNMLKHTHIHHMYHIHAFDKINHINFINPKHASILLSYWIVIGCYLRNQNPKSKVRKWPTKPAVHTSGL